MNAQPETTQYDTPGRHDGGGGPDVDEPSGPPYRAIAMVLLAAVVLAIGIGLVQLFGGDDDSTPAADDQSTAQVEEDASAQQGGEGQQGQQPGGTEGEPGTPGAGDDPAADGQQPTPGADGQQSAPEPDGQEPAPAPGEQSAAGPGGGDVPAATSVPVQVFNNSNVSGLAGRTGETLRENGYAVGDVANLPSSRNVFPESAAYYGSAPGEQQAAQAIAGQLGIAAKPRPADLAVQGDGVVVIVTQDLGR